MRYLPTQSKSVSFSSKLPTASPVYAQLINKKGTNGTPAVFTQTEVDRLELLCHHAGLALQTSLLYQHACTQATKSESLLTLAQHLSDAIMDERKLIATVMDQVNDRTPSASWSCVGSRVGGGERP